MTKRRGASTEMKERDFRMAALSLASQLPREPRDAHRIYELLGELLDTWLMPRPSDYSASSDSDSGASGDDPHAANNVTKFAGKRDRFPV